MLGAVNYNLWTTGMSGFVQLIAQVASDVLYANILSIVAAFVALGILAFVLRFLRERG